MEFRRVPAGSQAARSFALYLYGASQLVATNLTLTPEVGNSRTLTWQGDLDDTEITSAAGLTWTSIRRMIAGNVFTAVDNKALSEDHSFGDAGEEKRDRKSVV